MNNATPGSTTAALKDETGAFVMLAIDQRESLRAMIRGGADGAAVEDQALRDFKTRTAEILTPFASAILLDRAYGLPAAAAAQCAIILAADILHQEPGGPVTGASLDTGITPELVAEVGAKALKMLVPWLPDHRDEAIQLAADFMALCRECGVPGIVEGVVRPADIAQWSDEDRDQAIVQAAIDLATVKPDLYKAEVPSYGRGDLQAITETSRRITEALDCEWVILSTGVAATDFPDAVRACVRGGASGFLAGRAVWMDAFTAPDVDDFLRNESTRRLEVLADAAREARR